MAQTTVSARGARKSDRKLTLLWIAVATAIIIALIWEEQIALLYVVATLGLTVLLVVVGLADLGGARRPGAELAPYDDSAAMGDGLGASVNATATAASAGRTVKRR